MPSITCIQAIVCKFSSRTKPSIGDTAYLGNDGNLTRSGDTPIGTVVRCNNDGTVDVALKDVSGLILCDRCKSTVRSGESHTDEECDLAFAGRIMDE